MLSVGTAEAAPGTMATGRLTVGEDRLGQELGLPVAVLNGAHEGKRLYLQAASDGDELNGVGVLARLLPRLDASAFSGELVCVGVVNAFGFQAGTHRNPIDDTKVNRTYPGKAEGSSSERLAATTFEVAKQADLILDLHQGSTSRMIGECRVRCGVNHRLHDRCSELAKAFDTGFVLDRKGPEGQLARVAPDEGIPTVDPELGGSVGWDEASIQLGIEGVMNVLGYYDFLERSVSPGTQRRAHRFEQYGAPRGGLVEFTAPLGEEVSVGTPLFDIVSVFGERKARVTAEQSGILWRARRRPQVATGEYVCTLGTDLDTY